MLYEEDLKHLRKIKNPRLLLQFKISGQPAVFVMTDTHAYGVVGDELDDDQVEALVEELGVPSPESDWTKDAEQRVEAQFKTCPLIPLFVADALALRKALRTVGAGLNDAVNLRCTPEHALTLTCDPPEYGPGSRKEPRVETLGGAEFSVQRPGLSLNIIRQQWIDGLLPMGKVRVFAQPYDGVYTGAGIMLWLFDGRYAAMIMPKDQDRDQFASVNLPHYERAVREKLRKINPWFNHRHIDRNHWERHIEQVDLSGYFNTNYLPRAAAEDVAQAYILKMDERRRRARENPRTVIIDLKTNQIDLGRGKWYPLRGHFWSVLHILQGVGYSNTDNYGPQLEGSAAKRFKQYELLGSA